MVTIKDMEMPESCYDCDLNNYHFCNITESPDEFKQCGLKELKEILEVLR